MAGAGTRAKTDPLFLRLSKWLGDLFNPHPEPLKELRTNSAKVVSGQRAFFQYIMLV